MASTERYGQCHLSGLSPHEISVKLQNKSDIATISTKKEALVAGGAWCVAGWARAAPANDRGEGSSDPGVVRRPPSSDHGLLQPTQVRDGSCRFRQRRMRTAPFAALRNTISCWGATRAYHCRCKRWDSRVAACTAGRCEERWSR